MTGPHKYIRRHGCVSVPNGSSPSIARHASSGMTGGDPHHRRPLKRRAVRVKRRPVHHSVTGAAMPAGVTAAAVTEARDMPNQDSVRAERVAVGAAARWTGDPLAVGRLREVADQRP